MKISHQNIVLCRLYYIYSISYIYIVYLPHPMSYCTYIESCLICNNPVLGLRVIFRRQGISLHTLPCNTIINNKLDVVNIAVELYEHGSGLPPAGIIVCMFDTCVFACLCLFVCLFVCVWLFVFCLHVVCIDTCMYVPLHICI